MTNRYKDEDYDIEEQDLASLRKQYWDILVFTDEDGIQYFYRCLTKKEYFDFSAVCTLDDGEFDGLEFENYVVSACVILPSTFSVDSAKAGVISALADEIIKNSGFSQEKDEFMEMINNAKIEMVEPLNQVACYIVEAFPNISLEDVDNMPIAKILWLFSRADYIFRTIRGIDVNIMPPQEILEMNNIETGLEDENEEEDEWVEPQRKSKVTESETSFSGGSIADFPELREIEAFMAGKLK